MQRLCTKIFMVTSLLLAPLHSEFRLLVQGVPVSIPDTVKTVTDCSIGCLVAGQVTWVPFDQALQAMHGGSGGQWRSGNFSFSVGCNQDNRLGRLEYYQFVDKVKAVIKEVKKQEQTRQEHIRQQKIKEVARAQLEVDLKKITTFTQTSIQIQTQEQEDAFESLYYQWADVSENRYQQRAQILKKVLKEPVTESKQLNYQVGSHLQTCIKNYDPDSDYLTFTGTDLQHSVHQELLDLYQAALLSSEIDAQLIDQIGKTGALVNQANQAGQTVVAWQLLDWGWAVLDYAKAVACGIKEGVQDTVHAALHPIETLKQMAYGTLQIAQLSLNVLQAGQRLVGNALTDQQACAQQIQQYQQTISDFCKTLQAVPTTQLIQKTTAFLTQALLLHKTFGALPQLKELAKKSTRKAVAAIERIEHARSIAVTTEGVESSASPLFQAMAAEIEVIDQKIRGKIKTGFLGQAEEFIPFEQEISMLEDTFNGVIKVPKGCLGARSDICFEHILRGNIVLDSENALVTINGFHHDLLGVIETHQRMQGVPLIILEKETGPAGTYQLIFQGKHRRFPKTFFPQNWTRKQVIKKIIEAYKNSVKNKCAPIINSKGYFEVSGRTKEGIKIKIVFNKNGTVITAFPSFGAI